MHKHKARYAQSYTYTKIHIIPTIKYANIPIQQINTYTQIHTYEYTNIQIDQHEHNHI